MILTRIRPALRLAIASGLAILLGTLAASMQMSAQDSPSGRGRKYKPPPDTSHIEVIVTKGYNHKPIPNAAVVFHELREDGKDEGNLEVKTDPDGKAVIDVIPTGSNLRVQVIASGFATFAEDYLIKETSRQIEVTMIRPREQMSTYVDNTGKAASRPVGVQEPNRPTDGSGRPLTPATAPAPATHPAPATAPSTAPNQ